MKKERDCYSCDCFDPDYESCTMPGDLVSFCCPFEDDEELYPLEEQQEEKPF